MAVNHCGSLIVVILILIIMTCLILTPPKTNVENFKKADDRFNFDSFANEYNKSYIVDSEDYEKHFRNFERAIQETGNLNKNRNSSDLAVYGITKFADLSKEEFKSRYLQHRFHNSTRKHKLLLANYPNSLNEITNLPKVVDWRKRGIVTDVKNQGLCGACWAFSTVSVAESMNALKTGKLQVLSVQEIIDCARNGNFGCNGGDTCNLLEWLVSNKIKIELQKNYPLVLKNGVCKLKPTADGIQIGPNYSCTSFVGSEKQLLSIIAIRGPVAVAVNALSWQYYLGGVIKFHCDGSVENLNHAVVIVGYDLTAPTPYYIVRNSWGSSFGEKGYLKIAINENVCGIAQEVASFDVL